MSDRCPMCGAPTVDGATCRDRYELALATEFGDPAYFAVHHLSIPAYLLQHNEYSRAGGLWARQLLAAAIRDGAPATELRRQQRVAVNSGNREWSVTAGPGPEWFSDITWTRTIADVRFDSAEVYGADVRAWAEAVLTDTEPVVN